MPTRAGIDPDFDFDFDFDRTDRRPMPGGGEGRSVPFRGAPAIPVDSCNSYPIDAPMTTFSKLSISLASLASWRFI
ncbi:MAG: hypothetical protein ACOX52_19305 [Verrucomicrobiota bacterium]